MQGEEITKDQEMGSKNIQIQMYDLLFRFIFGTAEVVGLYCTENLRTALTEKKHPEGQEVKEVEIQGQKF